MSGRAQISSGTEAISPSRKPGLRSKPASMLRPILALFLVSAVWGSHPVVGKVVEGQMSPLALTVWRFTIAAVLYLPLLPRVRSILRQPVSVLWRLMATSIFWCVLYPLFYYQSLRTITPIDSLLLVDSAPLLAALFAFLFLKEKLRSLEWLGIVVAFGGVIVLTGRQISGHASGTGMMLAGLAAVSFAAYTVLSRKLFQEMPLFDVLFATSIIGAIGLWIYTAATGQLLPVARALGSVNATSLWQFAYIAVAVSTIAYVLYGYGLGRLPAAISSAVTFYPQVVFAGLVQWAWLGQVPTLWTVVAALFILAGTFLMSWRPRKSNQRGTSSKRRKSSKRGKSSNRQSLDEQAE